MITTQVKNKQVTRYRIYEDRPDEYYPEPEERYIVINKRQRSDIQRGLDWHVPKVNRSGAEFLYIFLPDRHSPPQQVYKHTRLSCKTASAIQRPSKANVVGAMLALDTNSYRRLYRL